MMYNAKVAVCSDIRTKHSTQSERHVELLNVKPWWYVNKPLGFKRLNDSIPSLSWHAIEVKLAVYFRHRAERIAGLSAGPFNVRKGKILTLLRTSCVSTQISSKKKHPKTKESSL